MRIVRVPAPRRRPFCLHHRAANYGSYLGVTTLTALRGGERPDSAVDDRPADRRRHRVDRRPTARRAALVISQDVFPEIAERGTASSTWSRPALRALRRRTSTTPTASSRSETREARSSAGRLLRPDRRDPELGRHEGDPAAVAPEPMVCGVTGSTTRSSSAHSGNIGHASVTWTPQVRAATFLRDLDRVRIMVIGFGARHGELVRPAQRLEVTSAVRFMDYQPRERLSLLARDGRPPLRRPRAGLPGSSSRAVHGVLAGGAARGRVGRRRQRDRLDRRGSACGLVAPGRSTSSPARSVTWSSAASRSTDG